MVIMILKANHKASGLSACVINRMLASPQLPLSVRTTILEYVAEKSAGYYGHGKKQIRRFTAGLLIQPTRRALATVEEKYLAAERVRSQVNAAAWLRGTGHRLTQCGAAAESHANKASRPLSRDRA
jgi:hypothetical protein